MDGIKGAYDGTCARTVCNHGGAMFYNISTRKFYCTSCARKINKACGEICVRKQESP